MSPFRNLTKSRPNAELTRLPPLGLRAKELGESFRHYFSNTFGRDRECRSAYYPYKALAIVLRDRLMERWKSTRYAREEGRCRQTYYLSMEFLMGRALHNAMHNLGIDGEAERALLQFGLVLEELADNEPDAGLGNGGLGRLAACFLDSCATLSLPVVGYGIR